MLLVGASVVIIIKKYNSQHTTVYHHCICMQNEMTVL